MKATARIVSFTSVGILATATHALTLSALSILNTAGWASNSFGFIAAFIVSFRLQQRYTFKDRLQGSALSKEAGFILFFLNLCLSAMLGSIFSKNLMVLLPLVPASINYIAYYLMTGMGRFKKKKGSE